MTTVKSLITSQTSGYSQIFNY